MSKAKKNKTNFAFLRVLLIAITIVAFGLFVAKKAVPTRADHENSSLHVVWTESNGGAGTMKWVLTVKGMDRFPESFDGGQVEIHKRDGSRWKLRNMWRFDPNDNVWVWEQYIPSDVLMLGIDTKIPIDWKVFTKRWSKVLSFNAVLKIGF